MDGREKQLLKQIKELHSQILKDSKDSLQRAIKLGGILNSYKETVGHGHFVEWVNTSLPFSERSSRNYMSLFRHKDRIQEQKITSLLQAYKLISNWHNYNTTVKRQEMKERRKEFANGDAKFPNPHSYVDKIVCGDCISVMDKMVKKGMSGQYSAVITSPPYNAGFDYGKYYDDSKPYTEYIDFLLKPFPYYLDLLRSGGRIIYVIGSMVNNIQREENGDYNFQLITDLTYRVREQFKQIKHYNNVIWDKGGKGRTPLNTKFGTYCSPLAPVCRSCHEHILIWSKERFELENESGQAPDIYEEEFKNWSWSVWKLEPFTYHKNPHPCSFSHKLISRLIKMYTYPGDMVLDSFCGAGITGQVAKKLGRKFTLIDINPNYCKYALQKLK